VNGTRLDAKTYYKNVFSPILDLKQTIEEA